MTGQSAMQGASQAVVVDDNLAQITEMEVESAQRGQLTEKQTRPISGISGDKSKRQRERATQQREAGEEYVTKKRKTDDAVSKSEEESENENKWSNRKEFIVQRLNTVDMDVHRLTPREHGMRESYLDELYEEFCQRHLSFLSDEQKTAFHKLEKPRSEWSRD